MHVGVVGSYHIKNVEVSQKIIGKMGIWDIVACVIPIVIDG